MRITINLKEEDDIFSYIVCVYIQVEMTVELQWSYSNGQPEIGYKDKNKRTQVQLFNLWGRSVILYVCDNY